MTQDRIDSLEELGFVWSLHEIWAQQDKKLELLFFFAETPF